MKWGPGPEGVKYQHNCTVSGVDCLEEKKGGGGRGWGVNSSSREGKGGATGEPPGKPKKGRGES